MHRWITLALLLPLAAAAEPGVDPDDFAVPEALPLRSMPIDDAPPSTPKPTADDAPHDLPLALPHEDGQATPEPVAATPERPQAQAPRRSEPPPRAERSPSTAASAGGAPTAGRAPSAARAAPVRRAQSDRRAPPPRATTPPSRARAPLAHPGPALQPRNPRRDYADDRAPIRGTAPPPCSPDHPCDDRAEPDRRDEDRRERGLFVGGWADITGVGGTHGYAGGLEIGGHLGRALTLSVAGGHLTDAQALDQLAFIGVRPGISFTPDRPLTLQADVLLSLAARTEELGRQHMQAVNFYEPRVGVGVALGQWGRLDAHVGYRALPKTHPGAQIFSAPTVGIGLRLGAF